MRNMVLTPLFVFLIANRKTAGKGRVCQPVYHSVSVKNCGRQEKKKKGKKTTDVEVER